MKQSVTATYLVTKRGRVYIRSRRAEYRYSSVDRDVVERVFGRIPEHGEYTVKYTLDEGGNYYVLPEDKGFALHPRLVRTGAYDEVVGIIACILPQEWKGQRVRREMVRPPKSETLF